MKISKLFHWLYASVMLLPLVVAPIFAIYMHRHPVTNYEVETGGGAIYSPIYSSNEVNDYADLVPYNIYSLNYFFADTSDLSTTAGEFGSFEISITFLQFDSLYLDSYSFDDFVQSDYSYLNFRFNILIQSSGFYLRLYSNDTEVDFVVENSLSFDDAIIYFGDSDSITYFEYLNNLEDANLPQYVDFNLYTASVSESIIYNDTDIGSQFVYSIYLPLDKYFNVTQFLGLNNLYSWINTNVFNGVAPLGFSIFYILLSYWLLVSIFWLVFDVVMYVPNLAHRWLDKGSLQ